MRCFRCIVFPTVYMAIVALVLDASPPATGLRIASLDAVASHDSAAFEAAMNTGQTPADSSLPGGETWVGRVQLPAMPTGGFYTFTVKSHLGYTASAAISLDSSDGIDGTWTEIPIPLWMPNENAAIRLQKVDLAPASEVRWFRLTLTNPSATAATTVANLELHSFAPGGADDYWLAIGASITSQGASHVLFKESIRELYGPDCDPVLFNLGVSGATTHSWLSGSPNRLEQVLDLHPKARYVVIHLGGNNVTAHRPFADGAVANDEIVQHLELICTAIKNAGMLPIPMRLSFRDYKTDPAVNGGANPENGSLPYNVNLIDPLIARVAPDAFDSESGLPRVDPYTVLLANQNVLSADGVHLGVGGRLTWSRDILAAHAGPIVYAGASGPLGFRRQPQDVVVFPGGRATLDFSTQGPLPSIQWLHDGSPVSGAASSRLIIEEVGASDVGSYQAVISTDVEGPIYSKPVALTLASDSIERTLSIDFGSSTYPTVSPDSLGNHWNNLSDTSAGSALQTLVLQDGTVHPDNLSLIVTSTFSGSNSGGTTASTLAPVEAARDTFYIKQSGVGRIQFSGLNASAYYDLTIFASRIGRGNTRTTRYEIEGELPRHLDAADNVDTTVRFADVSPSGAGTISISVSPVDVDNVAQDYAYIGYVQVVERTPTATEYEVWGTRNALSGLDFEKSSDPDRDGMSNLLEFSLGTDPRHFTTPPVLQRSIIGGESYLMLDVSRNPESSSRIFGEVSGDLSDWNSGPLHTTVLLETAERYQVRDNSRMSDYDARFIRLRVTE